MNALWIAAFLALQGAPQSVQRAIVVRPETVTVGDPFVVAVRVRVPRGAEIGFPDAPDSADAIELVDPVQITTAADSLNTDQTAVYRLSAWDVGRIPIAFGHLRLVTNGRIRDVPLGSVSVFVASVLPADTSLHIPKPARDVLPVPAPWWFWLLIAAIVALFIALLWWWWRRRRRLELVALRDPYEEAAAAFARIEALGLLSAGERGRYVALMVEVLREYICRIDARADLALTTSELLAVIPEVPGIPGNRLAALLVEADLIKFARRAVTAAHAEQLGNEAKQIVAFVHTASQLQAPQEAAA